MRLLALVVLSGCGRLGFDQSADAGIDVTVSLDLLVHLRGLIDDVRFYTRALTPAEIMQLATE